MQTMRAFSTAFQSQQAPVVKRGGYIRGGLFGFLLGFSLCATGGYVLLLEDYQAANTQVIAGVDQVQKQTKTIQDKLSKIDKLESQLKTIQEQYALKKDLSDTKNDLLNVIDQVQVEGLETKTQVWELARSIKK
ncbi:hypothetical protein EDD86DRAFT_197957, partial [Gorgonomyces haynaldii]